MYVYIPKAILIVYFSSAGEKNKPHDAVAKTCIFFNLAWSRTPRFYQTQISMDFKARGYFNSVPHFQFTCLELLFRTSRWRPHKVDKRMVLEYTHGLFIT